MGYNDRRAWMGCEIHPKRPKRWKNLQLLIFFKDICQSGVLKKSHRGWMLLKTNSQMRRGAPVRMVTRFASVRPKLAVKKIAGFHRLECAWLVVSKAYATREKVGSA